MKTLKESKSIDKKALYDPEPLTIAISLISAVVPIGTFFADKAFKRRNERKSRSDAIRNGFYDVRHALRDTRNELWEFRYLLAESGHLESDLETSSVRERINFRLGGAPIIGDSDAISNFKNLYKHIYQAGKNFNNAVISLSRLLDEDDFQVCISFSESLNDDLNNAMRAENYIDYLEAMGRFIGAAERLIGKLGVRYGLVLYNRKSYKKPRPVRARFPMHHRTSKND